VVLSIVPNHSSKKHPWFVKSERNDAQYKDYYIWSSGRVKYDPVHGKPEPPNNWVCKKHYATLYSSNRITSKLYFGMPLTHG
jgi:glycosidase